MASIWLHLPQFKSKHLGIDCPNNDSAKLDNKILGDEKDSKSMKSVDRIQPIRNSPTAYGFDSYYGITTSLDMPRMTG